MNKIDSKNTIITRFAPSPTGFLTLGNYRTALFSYLFAKQNNGKFILRIEDTDIERSKKEYEDDILESFKWLSLDYNEFYRQSDRSDIYKKYLKKLFDEDIIYLSKEEVKQEGDREEVIRFRNPNKKVTFTDLIRGEVTFDTTDLGDFVIAKSMDEPLFHLAVVVDDFEMGITHVIRGEDHISNTPRQILIMEAIGASRPRYAHLPLILAPDRSKLSKRNGAISIKDCKEIGYLPEVIINYLALLGWNPGTDKEIFSIEELENEFNLSKIQKSGAIFNVEKLDWLNKEYLKKITEEEKNKKIFEILSSNPNILNYKQIKDENFIKKICPLIFDRISKWKDVNDIIDQGELDYFFEQPKYNIDLLNWKNVDKEETKKHLIQILDILSKSTEDNFDSTENIKNLIFGYATENGRGNVLWPLRFSLSGKDKSPDPFTIIYVLGKDESIKRVAKAIENL